MKNWFCYLCSSVVNDSFRSVAMPQDKDRRIDYIEIPVADVAAAKTFYGEAFGWTFKDYGPDNASFHDNNGIGGGLRGQANPKIGGALIVIYAANLNKLRDSILAAGGKIN